MKIYRLEENARILAALKANGSILLCGDEGSGKTVLLDAVREDLTVDGYRLAAILSPATVRQMLIAICEQLGVVRGLDLSQSQLADLQQRAGGNPALAIRSIDRSMRSIWGWMWK
jgi:DNA replication protein DnaC